jgi:glycine betaine catabolism B
MAIATSVAPPECDAETVGLHDVIAGLMPPSWSPECWSDAEHAHLVCRKVLDVTHDVKSFLFEAPEGHVFRFDPGQFITIQLEIDGRHVSRCYTISSPPTRPHLIAITVKRVVGGPVSNWLHDNVIPGSRIAVAAPLGSFTIAGRNAAKYLFLSAGSGVTPVMSMTRTLYDLGSDADILFIHSARTPADIIFRRELDAMASMTPNIRVANICEDDHPFERWHGLRGRLSTAALQALAPDLTERVTFTCGPSAYMASVRNILAEIGYDMRNYHEESFSFETLSVPTRPAVDAIGQALSETVRPLAGQSPTLSDAGSQENSAAVYSVEFARTGRTITCGADETVLDAAWTAGLTPPSSCTQGMCGTCKTTVLSGQVDMQHNGGIRPKEVDQNKILICCSKPLSDLRIDC